MSPGTIAKVMKTLRTPYAARFEVLPVSDYASAVISGDLAVRTLCEMSLDR
jgi:hypothetical protein